MRTDYTNDSHLMKRILIVDDQLLVRKLLSRMLERESSFVVRTASSMEEALKEISLFTPDLILLDIDLGSGQKDGLTCLQNMRENGYNGIICMLTGDPSPDRLYDALIVGADDYIVKNQEFDVRKAVKKMISLTRNEKFQGTSATSISKLSYLKSRGIRDIQLDILNEFIDKGFPKEKELSKLTGKSENAIWKQFHHIRDKLEIKNNTQLVHILTILSGYVKKRRHKIN